MIDIRSAQSTPFGYQYLLWAAAGFMVNDFDTAHAWTVDRYQNDDMIIAIDVKNVRHGKMKNQQFAK
jgi:hypothetical protein